MAEKSPMPMLTEEEIVARKGENFWGDVAREALSQAEKCLADCLETKKAIEQRATSLLGGFVTLSVALTGGAVAASKIDENIIVISALLLCAFLFSAGAALFAVIQYAQDYSILGDHPRSWVTDGVIYSQEPDMGIKLAIRAVQLQPKIDSAIEANYKKAIILNAGITCGLASAWVFFGSIFYWLFFTI